MKDVKGIAQVLTVFERERKALEKLFDGCRIKTAQDWKAAQGLTREIGVLDLAISQGVREIIGI